MNRGGSVGSTGKSLRGSPMMFLMIRNLSGSSPITGLTLRCTGLYFFLAETKIGMGSRLRLGMLEIWMGSKNSSDECMRLCGMGEYWSGGKSQMVS